MTEIPATDADATGGMYVAHFLCPAFSLSLYTRVGVTVFVFVFLLTFIFISVYVKKILNFHFRQDKKYTKFSRTYAPSNPSLSILISQLFLFLYRLPPPLPFPCQPSLNIITLSIMECTQYSAREQA